jgi:hypothetical protein
MRKEHPQTTKTEGTGNQGHSIARPEPLRYDNYISQGSRRNNQDGRPREPRQHISIARAGAPTIRRRNHYTAKTAGTETTAIVSQGPDPR